MARVTGNGVWRRGRMTWLAMLFMSVPGGAAAQEGADRLVDFRVIQRTRYESLNSQFRPGASRSDQALALQTSFFFDVGRGPVRFHGELMDARHLLNDDGSFINTTMVNALEPLQAYVAWKPEQGWGGGELKAGRFTLDVGRRRLAARSNFRNSINSFAGVEWQRRDSDGRIVQAFYTVPMRILPTGREDLLDNDYELDRGTRDARFWGALYQFPLARSRDRVELYWLVLDQDERGSTPARDLSSPGFRIFRPSAPGKWTYEVEAVRQSGESSATGAGVVRRGLDHHAVFYHWEFGYAFESRWSPVLLLQYDDASGDEDPYDQRNEGYDTLFGERRFDFAPQGIYGAFARGNLRTPGVRLTLRPTSQWQAMVSYRKFELAQARDAWSGVGLRDETGRAGRSIGTQLEGSVTWTAPSSRISIEAGMAHLWAGRFLRETSGDAFRGDPNYFYTTMTTRF